MVVVGVGGGGIEYRETYTDWHKKQYLIAFECTRLVPNRE
jgi:hypothetical protein